MSDLIVEIVDTVADPVQAELKSDDLAVFIGYNENDPLPAPPGPPGTPVEFRNSGTSIDWKYIDEVDWTVLILLEDITPPGGGVTLPISQSDVDGLVDILNGKADFVHTHTINEIEGLVTQLTSITNRLTSLESNSSSFSSAISNINNSLNGLNTALSDLTNSVNSQLQTVNLALSNIDSQIVDLQTEVGNKEPTIIPGDANEFLSGNKTFKQITIEDILDLLANLNSKASTEHFHLIEEVDGLQESLDAKASNDSVTAISTDRRGSANYRRSQRWYLPSDNATSLSNTNHSTPSIFFVPFIVEKQITIDAIAIEVVTAGSAGSIGYFGLYSGNGTTCEPVNKLLDSGSISMVTTGVKQVNLVTPYVLAPGLYFTAFSTGSATTHQIRSMQVFSFSTVIGSANAGGANQGSYINGVRGAFGTLPANTSGLTLTPTTGAIYGMWYKIQ